MPAQKKPSLETISEGWQDVAPRSSSAMTPMSEQDASSSSSTSGSNHPTAQHIEDIAAHADSSSVDSVDSNASMSDTGRSSSPTSVSGTASTRARADSPSEASTWGDESVSASFPTPTTSVRVLRVSTEELDSSLSDPRAESSSSAATAHVAVSAEAVSGADSFSDSSDSSDDSFMSTSEEITIPGTHVFPLVSTAGTAGRPSSPVSGVRANSGSSAAATTLAPTNAGISGFGGLHNSGIFNRVFSHRATFPTQSFVARSSATSQNPTVHQSLVEQRDSFRNNATATHFAGINYAFAQRRAQEARLAAQGYSPRDIHPHPLRSYPVDPPCTGCGNGGLLRSRPTHVCFNCRALLEQQITYGNSVPHYSPETRGPAPGIAPTPLVRGQNVVCSVIDQAARAGDATMANGGMGAEPDMSNNVNNHVTGNNDNGPVTVDTAEGAYQAQDVRTGIRSDNDTSGNVGPSDEEYDEPTESLLQSGIPIAAMLEFSDSAVGGDFDGDGDDDEYES